MNGRIENKVMHLPGIGKGVGEIRAQNEYLVAPGTAIKWGEKDRIPAGTGIYKITNNAPIKEIEASRFNELMEPYLGTDVRQKITPEIMAEGADEGVRHQMALKFALELVGVQKLDFNAVVTALNIWLCQMPPFLQTIAQVLPLTYVNEGLRAAMIFGQTQQAIINTALVTVLGIAFIVVGSLITKWEED